MTNSLYFGSAQRRRTLLSLHWSAGICGGLNLIWQKRLSLPTAIAEPNPRAETAAVPSLRPIALWLLCCCGMIFVMVVIGGITRLTLSGLSITEWQPVTGILPPLSATAWTAEFEKYQHIPQYRLLNPGMSLDAFKTIFLWGD